MNGKIYIIKNKINNKVYIGQTIRELNIRFRQHISLDKHSSNMLIYKAIARYGKENFYIELLKDDIDNYSELNYYEEYYIKKYNSLKPNGYNISPGGQKYRRAPIELSTEIISTIIENYINGESLRKISEKTNLSTYIVTKVLKKNNIILRNKTEKLPNRTSKITKNILQTFDFNKISNNKIAKILNVNEKTIRRARKRYNL